MRIRAIVLALLGMTLASSDATAVTTYSSSLLQKIIATATVPDRNDTPLYFSVVAGRLEAGETRGVASGDGVYYQLSGAVDINIQGSITTLNAGDGVFVPAGTEFTLKPHDAEPAPTYLKFLLLPATGFQHPAETRLEREVYRSPSPLLRVMAERNLLTLSRVEVPPESPCDPPHWRSGAALHYILSGFGAEFTETRATTKGPGSVSYEPNRLAYQWSNPGTTPLVYLLFNVNPKDEPPVLAANERPIELIDPFSSDFHISVAIYCIAISMILTVVVAARIAADFYDDVKPGGGRGK
jgi:hypothetical protein